MKFLLRDNLQIIWSIEVHHVLNSVLWNTSFLILFQSWLKMERIWFVLWNNTLLFTLYPLVNEVIIRTSYYLSRTWNKTFFGIYFTHQMWINNPTMLSCWPQLSGMFQPKTKFNWTQLNDVTIKTLRILEEVWKWNSLGWMFVLVSKNIITVQS